MSIHRYDLIIRTSDGHVFKRINNTRENQMQVVNDWLHNADPNSGFIKVPHEKGEWNFRRDKIIFMGVEITQEEIKNES